MLLLLHGAYLLVLPFSALPVPDCPQCGSPKRQSSAESSANRPPGHTGQQWQCCSKLKKTFMSVRTYVNDWPIRDGFATCQPLGLLSPESSLCRWSWSEWIGKLTINLPQPCSHLRLLSFSMIVPALFHCRKAKSPDSAINTAMYVNGLAGTEQDYQQRCDDLKVLLQSMEESGNRPGSRTSNRPVLVCALSIGYCEMSCQACRVLHTSFFFPVKRMQLSGHKPPKNKHYTLLYRKLLVSP